MAKKSTRAETLKRVNDVYSKLIGGWAQPDILVYGRNLWGVSDGAVRKYIQTANVSISEFAKEYQENALEMNLAKRADLYRKAMEEDDLRLALEVARDESKLLGLYAPDRSKVENVNIDIPWNDLSEDQIKRLAAGESLMDVLGD